MSSLELLILQYAYGGMRRLCVRVFTRAHGCMCLRVVGTCVSLGTPVYAPIYVFVSLWVCSVYVCV